MSTFTEVTCRSPQEAEQLLFEKAVPATAIETQDRIRKDYESLQRSWGASFLVEDTEAVVRAVALRNLQRIAGEPGFEEFAIVVDDRDVTFAQANGFFAASFVPVRVWRSEDKLYVCGNSLFER